MKAYNTTLEFINDDIENFVYLVSAGWLSALIVIVGALLNIKLIIYLSPIPLILAGLYFIYSLIEKFIFKI